MSRKTDDALAKLSRLEGMTLTEMLEQATFDGRCQSVCVTRECNFTVYLEPDGGGENECPKCGTKTVATAMFLFSGM